MNTKRIQDAEKLVKKGEEHLKTGLFKWSPDIDSAIECFDKGNLGFRIFDQKFLVEIFVLESFSICPYQNVERKSTFLSKFFKPGPHFSSHSALF